jgi:hypothetical protein
MHLVHGVAALVAVLSGLLVLAGPAAAQTSTYPESMLKISYEPRMIAAQLQAALAEAKKARAGYEVLGPDDPVEGPLQAIINSYFLMRVALAGMGGINGQKKFPDPLLELALNKTKQAWNRARGPIDSVKTSRPRTEYLEWSRVMIEDVVVLLEQVVAFWP